MNLICTPLLFDLITVPILFLMTFNPFFVNVAKLIIVSSQVTISILLYDIIVRSLSNKLLSKFGSFTEVTIIAISTLAI